MSTKIQNLTILTLFQKKQILGCYTPPGGPRITTFLLLQKTPLDKEALGLTSVTSSEVKKQKGNYSCIYPYHLVYIDVYMCTKSNKQISNRPNSIKQGKKKQAP
jgi:hypothetical protein